MGKDHGLNIAGSDPERGEIRRQAAAEAGQAGVDRGQAPLILDHVPVHQRASETVDASGDFASQDDRGILLLRWPLSRPERQFAQRPRCLPLGTIRVALRGGSSGLPFTVEGDGYAFAVMSREWGVKGGISPVGVCVGA